MVDVSFNYVLNTIQVQSIIMVNFNHSGFVFLGGIPHQYVTLFVRLFLWSFTSFCQNKIGVSTPLTPKCWELPCENCLSPKISVSIFVAWSIATTITGCIGLPKVVAKIKSCPVWCGVKIPLEILH